MSDSLTLRFVLAMLMLVGLFAVLANAVWSDYRQPLRLTMPRSVDPLPLAMPVLPSIEDQAGRQFAQRPLFWASRRPIIPPPSVKPVVGKAEPSEKLSFKVSGIALSGDQQVVFLVDSRGNSGAVHLNEEFQGWKVTDVTAHEVTLRKDGDVEVLPYRKDPQ